MLLLSDSLLPVFSSLFQASSLFVVVVAYFGILFVFITFLILTD